MSNFPIDIDSVLAGYSPGLISNDLINKIRDLVEEIKKVNKEPERKVSIQKSYIDKHTKKFVIVMIDNGFEVQRLLDL